ncbi:aspartyl protease family protein [Sphingomonas sp.]|uniref:aspartyl protease family protein n=1 Tax=Sphingomonas sp. TaxID=28214 RepID=UPI0038B372E9
MALCSQPAAAGWNPYATPTDEFSQHLQAAAFGEPGADRALEDWLATHPDLAVDRRTQGYEQLCRDYGFLTWNRIRARVCTELSSLKKAKSGDDEGGIATAFADEPPIRAIGSARVPLTWNAFGSQSADVIVNGITSSWFVDSGAEITVITQSLAARMAARPVGKAIRVGTTTSDVTGKVGMIDRLQIGSAFVENVPVLILPDSQLRPGNVHQIDGVLGLQLFVAFGRMAWVDGGRALALGDAAPSARSAAPHIYWQEEGVGVPVRTPRGVMGAFLDTGANTTDWRTAGTALLDPEIITSARERISRVGGAGGVVELKRRELRDVAFQLGAVPIRLEAVWLAADPRDAAKIGMDAVSQFGTFILDFEQMRIDGRPKTAAERKATRKTVPTQKDVKLGAGKEGTERPPK